jgi:hypothetical protein
MQARLGAAGSFLWIDDLPDRGLRVRRGAIVVAPGGGNGTQPVPDGLIHHWIAAGFIPRVKLSDVLRVAHDYANYKQYYRPQAVDSALLSYNGDQRNFSMRSVYGVLFVTAVLKTEFATHEVRVDPARCYIVSDSTRIQEVENYGRSNERLLPPNHGTGYLWRLHTVTRYEERDGGVYVEMEALALSRDIPAAIRLLFKPAIAHFSEAVLMASLRQTREVVNAAVETVLRSKRADMAVLAFER